MFVCEMIRSDQIRSDMSLDAIGTCSPNVFFSLVIGSDPDDPRAEPLVGAQMGLACSVS